MSPDVAQLVLRKNEVVARIDIAIVLHHSCMTAFLGIDANARLHAHPACKRGIEELHEDFADILLYPLVEDGTHEPPPLFWPNAEGRYGTILVEELSQMTSVTMFLDALHNRTDLQELAMQFITEELVEGQRVLGIMVIGGCHRIPLDTIFVEQLYASHHSVPSAIALNIATISIVLLLCAVDADAHKPAFVVKELAPFGRKVEAVGLYAVANALASAIILLKLDCLLIKT